MANGGIALGGVAAGGLRQQQATTQRRAQETQERRVDLDTMVALSARQSEGQALLTSRLSQIAEEKAAIGKQLDNDVRLPDIEDEAKSVMVARTTEMVGVLEDQEASIVQALNQQGAGLPPPVRSSATMADRALGIASTSKRRRESAVEEAQTEALAGAQTAELRGQAEAVQSAAVVNARQQLGLPPLDQSTVEKNVTGLTKLIGRPLNEQEVLTMAGATRVDPLESIIRDGEPALVRRSEVQPGDQPLITGLNLTVGPDGTVTVSEGPQGVGAKGLTAKQALDVQQRLDALDEGVNVIDQLISIGQQPGAQLGALGTLSRLGREGLRLADEAAGAPIAAGFESMGRMAEDLIGQELETGQIDPEVAGLLLEGDDLTNVPTLERRLAYFYARGVLQPNDRLLKDTIKSAQEAVKITGLVSEKTALERMANIRSGFTAMRQRFMETAGGAGVERPQADLVLTPDGQLIPAGQ